PNVTTYASTGLTAASTYTHRVRAYDGPNDSGYPNAAAATTLPAPAAPSGLLATPTSPSRIDLAWTDNAANEQGFKVERATGGGGFSVIATLGASVTAYANTYLVSGSSYTYRVRAYEGPNDSPPSNTATATPLAVPATPTGLTATPVSQTRIDLQWVDNSSYEAGYKVERATGGGSFAQVAMLGANATSYSSTGLAAGTTYMFRVRA